MDNKIVINGAPEPQRMKAIRGILMKALESAIEGEALSVMVIMENTDGEGFTYMNTPVENPITFVGILESIKLDLLIGDGDEEQEDNEQSD